jgi:hypothetical protein
MGTDTALVTPREQCYEIIAKVSLTRYMMPEPQIAKHPKDK